MNHNNTYFFSNTQYFNHTASFMEATIFDNKPETHSEDSMLFRKISCRISHSALSEWPVLKDFVKWWPLKMHAKLRMLIINSPGRSVAFVPFLAYFTSSGGVIIFFYNWVWQHHKHTHIWERTQFCNILQNTGVPKNGRFDQFPQLNLVDARKAHRRGGNTTCKYSSQVAVPFVACYQKKVAFVVLAKAHKTSLYHNHPSITWLQTLMLSPLHRTHMGNMVLENGIKATVFSAKINYWGLAGISAPDWSTHR